MKCDRGYLQAFSQKNTLIEWAEKKDRTIKSIADYEKCGKLNTNSTSNFIASDNPRLLLIFDSHGSPPGRGFKASYQFKTGERIFLQYSNKCSYFANYPWHGERGLISLLHPFPLCQLSCNNFAMKCSTMFIYFFIFVQ